VAKLAFSRSFWLLVCALAVAGIVASGWRMQVRPPATLPQTPPAQAEYYLRDAVVEVMDDSGRLGYRMRTSELLRYSDHSSQLTDVQIESLGGEQGVWRLEAGQARITENQERMLLSNGVRMQTSGPRGATRLTTMTLNVELKDKQLNTADPVQIAGPDFEAQGVGMRAAFNNRNMTLLNKVRTRYVP
jgi:LPS export ABC transporter protein LptC